MPPTEPPPAPPPTLFARLKAFLAADRARQPAYMDPAAPRPPAAQPGDETHQYRRNFKKPHPDYQYLGLIEDGFALYPPTRGPGSKDLTFRQRRALGKPHKMRRELLSSAPIYLFQWRDITAIYAFAYPNLCSDLLTLNISFADGTQLELSEHTIGYPIIEFTLLHRHFTDHYDRWFQQTIWPNANGRPTQVWPVPENPRQAARIPHATLISCGPDPYA